ncbi:Uncharacterised protein [Mycobacterium tuberculosis]|nr:Uncharacterised protein [Mycobacterium tuberculosis]
MDTSAITRPMATTLGHAPAKSNAMDSTAAAMLTSALPTNKPTRPNLSRTRFHNAIPPKSPTQTKRTTATTSSGWSPGTAATRMLWNEDPSTTEPKSTCTSRYRRYQPLVRIAVQPTYTSLCRPGAAWTLGTIR